MYGTRNLTPDDFQDLQLDLEVDAPSTYITAWCFALRRMARKRLFQRQRQLLRISKNNK